MYICVFCSKGISETNMYIYVILNVQCTPPKSMQYVNVIILVCTGFLNATATPRFIPAGESVAPVLSIGLTGSSSHVYPSVVGK